MIPAEEEDDKRKAKSFYEEREKLERSYREMPPEELKNIFNGYKIIDPDVSSHARENMNLARRVLEERGEQF